MRHVLAIGYGRHLFDTNHPEHKRLVACAATVSALHVIVFTHRRDGFVRTQPAGTNLWLHPTHARTKVGHLAAAVSIGRRLTRPYKDTWVVTAQDPFEAGLVGYLVARGELPLNIQEHGDFFSTPYWRQSAWLNRLRFRFGLWLLPRATTVRVVSERIKRTLLRFGLSEDRLAVLSVRSDRDFSSLPERAKEQHDKSTIKILTIARLTVQKNISLLLRAFAAVHGVHPTTQLIIVGNGDCKERLQTESRQLGISDAVVWEGWTDHPEAFFSTADVYALSSDWEGWARVLPEAMAAGVPIVTTDVGCAGELVIDGVHGLVVQVRDERAFTTALMRMVEYSTLRAHCAQAGQQTMQTPYTLQEYAADWHAVLEMTAVRFHQPSYNSPSTD